MSKIIQNIVEKSKSFKKYFSIYWKVYLSIKGSESRHRRPLYVVRSIIPSPYTSKALGSTFCMDLLVALNDKTVSCGLKDKWRNDYDQKRFPRGVLGASTCPFFLPSIRVPRRDIVPLKKTDRFVHDAKEMDNRWGPFTAGGLRYSFLFYSFSFEGIK